MNRIYANYSFCCARSAGLRTLFIGIAALLSAAMLAAQPPAPPIAPVPPVPPAAPAEPVGLRDLINGEVREQLDLVRQQVRDLRLTIDPVRGMHIDFDPFLIAQRADNAAQEALDRMHASMDRARASMERARDRYSRGMDALDERNYERALTNFDEYYRSMNGQKDSRADGALYWKAYALNKLGRRDDATATLAQLGRTIPPAAGSTMPRRCSWRCARAPARAPLPKPRATKR